MHVLSLIPFLALAASPSVAARLAKRCTPEFNADYYLGYKPPVPCWQDFDPACQPYIKKGTKMVIDDKLKQTTISGVDDSCKDQITEELKREGDHRKNNGWVEAYGNLEIKGETLVISNMPDAAIKKFHSLKYQDGSSGETNSEGPSCS